MHIIIDYKTLISKRSFHPVQIPFHSIIKPIDVGQNLYVYSPLQLHRTKKGTKVTSFLVAK
jgi:hypothetical protein